jgi:putative oligomerization/nucleic acid binding protein
MTDANLRIGEVALELLAWDKRRATILMEPEDFVETERLIDRGANSHRRLLAALHEESDGVSLVESDEWLVESRARWRDREEMTERDGFLRGRKLRLTKDDFARIDRVHPERSFSASPPVPVEIPGARYDAADPSGQLQRLRSLRAEGVLTEEEFRAAEARLLD